MSTAQTSGSMHLHPGEEWSRLLEQATREVFEIMLASQLSLSPDGKTIDGAALTGMVGLAGAACGVLSIRCSFATANKIAAKMLGQDAADSDETIVDALGEVCNMVAGSFKAKVPGMADGCMLSVPSVISGTSYELHALANGVRCEVNVIFEEELVEVALDVDQ
jgi:chemotaxis protein CheX